MTVVLSASVRGCARERAIIVGVTPITFAHRGARIDERENTLVAFRRALALGASGLETDARLSSDGEVVLVHDPVTLRGHRRRNVASSTAADLVASGVPRLADLYAELGSGFDLSIDLMVPGVAGRILDVAAAAGDKAPDRLWLCSPDLDLLRGLRDRASQSGARLVHSRRHSASVVPLERHAAVIAEIPIDAMNFHHTEWTAGLVALFDRFGVRAFAWDAQEVRQLRSVLAMGVDAVYCDRPERMVSAVREWRARSADAHGSASEEVQP